MDAVAFQTLPADILALGAAMPEIWLVLSAVLLLVIGVLKGNESTISLSHLSLVALAVTSFLLLRIPAGELYAFNGMFVANAFTHFTKQLVLLGSFLVIILSISGYKADKHSERTRFEFPVLILLATAGMMLMISANNLIALYVGLELQSLSLYVLATMQRDSLKSSEAGLKYFILGALASGLLLYGCSLVYGFAGSTDFRAIAALYETGVDTPEVSIGVLVGLIFVIIGFCFKVSAVPFHMWTPDVYEGSPTVVTAFFASAPKVAALSLFIRLVMEPFGNMVEQWQQVVIFVSAASMIIGALGALRQTNIKRLLAYSSIGHVGYALLGVATASEQGIFGVLVYLALYVTMTIGAFGCVLMMKKRGLKNSDLHTEEIADLAGLAKAYPLRAMALAIFMFSMAGIPPLAGFWGKFFIFQAAVQQELYILAVLGVLTSVIAAFYYLRIVKVMYFDEAGENLAKNIGAEIGGVTALAALFNIIFFIVPAPLFNAAKHAAAALLL